MSDRQLTPIPTDVSLRALDEVTADWYHGATSGRIEVPVAKLRSVIDLVELSRIRLSRQVLSIYEEARVSPFAPVVDGGGNPHLGLLLEDTKAGLLILDGTHRAYAAHLEGLVRLTGTLISPIRRLPPPATLLPLSRLREVTDGGEPKFVGRDVRLFRPATEWAAAWGDRIMTKEA